MAESVFFVSAGARVYLGSAGICGTKCSARRTGIGVRGVALEQCAAAFEQFAPRGTSGTERYGTKREIGLLRYFLINGQISTRYSRPYSVGRLLDGRDSAEFVARLEQDLGRLLAPRPGQQTRVKSVLAISQ